MSLWQVIGRNLLFFRRHNLGIILAAAMCSLVLTGALTVGDSVRATLRSLAEQRIGKGDIAMLSPDGFFEEDLANRIHDGLKDEQAVVAHIADPSQMGLGLDHHITTEVAVFTQRATAGIHEGDAFIHPVVSKPLLQECLTLRQLASVIDAVHFISIGHFHMHGFGQHRHCVGEVELALVVVGAQLRQHLSQRLPVEAVDARIGEVVAALLFSAIAVLNDVADCALCVSKHAPVTRGIGQSGRQQGH